MKMAQDMKEKKELKTAICKNYMNMPKINAGLELFLKFLMLTFFA